MITSVAEPGNPGTVPPWLNQPIPLPLPDPLGDTPMILPMPEWPRYEAAHHSGALLRIAEMENASIW